MDEASQWVRRFGLQAPLGEVLDLACGTGRHARLFASTGRPVLAVDRDHAALAQARGEGITTMQFDLEDAAQPWPFAAGRFAAIVVTNYLHRPLMPALAASLAPNGLLIYETFGAGNEAFGRPGNPDFLLQDGELLALAADAQLRVVAYEAGFSAIPKPAMLQRLCAVGQKFPRATALLDRFEARF